MKTTRVFCDHCGKEISKSYRNARIKIEVRDSGEYTRQDFYDKDFELCNSCTVQLNDYINKYFEGCKNG